MATVFSVIASFGVTTTDRPVVLVTAPRNQDTDNLTVENFLDIPRRLPEPRRPSVVAEPGLGWRGCAG
jgi:hypothetical protein